MQTNFIQHNKITLIVLITFFSSLQANSQLLNEIDKGKVSDIKFWSGDIAMVPHGFYRGSGLAPDGSFILGEGEDGSLMKLSLQTGKQETLVKTDRPKYCFASAVSRNSKQVAFQMFNGDFFDLLVVPTNTDKNRVEKPRLLVQGSEKNSATPYDWSPDNKWILVHLFRNDTSTIALVSIKDGSIKKIKDFGVGLFNKISFSPDGKYIVYDWKNGIYQLNLQTGKELLLVSDTINLYGAYWSPDGNAIVYFKNSAICSLPLLNGKVAGASVVLKEGIDFFDLLGFLNNGSFLYSKSSKIKLNVYTADPQSTSVNPSIKLISTRFVDSNTDPVWSPDGKFLAYKSGRDNGDEMIVIRSYETGDERDLVPVKGSIVQWNTSNSLLIQKFGNFTSLSRINIQSGDTVSLFRIKNDFDHSIWRERPVLSPDNKKVYYVETDRENGFAKILSYDLIGGDTKEVTSFDTPDITSFSISPDGKYLSAVVLRQGEEGRPSALCIVSVQTGEVRQLFKEPWGDATKFFGLDWSPDSRYIFYVRNNWKEKLNVIYRIPIDKGTPEKTTIQMKDLRFPRIHPLGKEIAFYGGDGWFVKTMEVRSLNLANK